MIDLLHDTQIWFSFSFIVFAILAWRFGKQAILAKIDGQIDSIRQDLERAESLRVEAQELLAQYQRKQRDAEKEAKKIIDTAKTQAEAIQAKAEAELDETIFRREKQLEERLSRMEQAAALEIQNHAAELALKATTEIVSRSLDAKTNKKLVDQAISQVSTHIH